MRTRYQEVPVASSELSHCSRWIARAFANLRRLLKKLSINCEQGEYLVAVGGVIDLNVQLLDEVRKCQGAHLEVEMVKTDG